MQAFILLMTQWFVLPLPIGIRTVTNQLYADTSIITCNRRLCQRSLQSAYTAKLNEVTILLDFPCMPYVVRKLGQDICMNSL
mmetsp:Transcript_12883/g.12693  ORF Transcript_12883/g.12693 Transcript_12883/m.12693 type:complete len:82 (-) Transcript_12883:84-329(-)